MGYSDLKSSFSFTSATDHSKQLSCKWMTFVVADGHS